MDKKNTSKKAKQVKSKRTKTQVVGGVRKVHKTKGQEYMLYMREVSPRKWTPRWTLHCQKCGRAWALFSRRKRTRTVL